MTDLITVPTECLLGRFQSLTCIRRSSESIKFKVKSDRQTHQLAKAFHYFFPSELELNS